MTKAELPPEVRVGSTLRDKETGEEFTVTNIGFFVQYENPSTSGEVRSDILLEMYEAIPPKDTDVDGIAVIGDEDTTKFEQFAYQAHYNTSLNPMSTAEFLSKTADGSYATPGLDDMKAAWQAGRQQPVVEKENETIKSLAWQNARLKSQINDLTLHAMRLHRTCEIHAVKDAPDLIAAMDCMTSIKQELRMTPQYALSVLPSDCQHMVVMQPSSELDLFINSNLARLGQSLRGLSLQSIQAKAHLDALKALSGPEFRARAHAECYPDNPGTEQPGPSPKT